MAPPLSHVSLTVVARSPARSGATGAAGYFAVEPARGADATAGHAMMLGGEVITDPHDTQSGRTATLADPDGALFSVIDHSRPVDLGVGRSEVDDPHGD